MYSRNSFGSYYPIDSAVHRLNPIIKLVNFLICLILISGTNFLSIHLFLFAFVIVLMLLSFVPIKFYFKTFWSLRYIYLIIAFAVAYGGGSLELFFVLLLKLVILVEYLNVIIYTTSPSEMCFAIEKTFRPFNFLHLPISKIALAITNAIRFIPLMLTTEYKTLKAQSSRGIDYYHTDIIGRFYAVGNILRNTFYLTKKKMKDIHFSSELRMFSVKRLRTNYRTNKAGLYDLIITLFHILIVVGYIFERGLIG